jgi:hypothetical protein
VKRVSPESVRFVVGARDIEIDDHRFLSTTDDDRFHRLIFAGIQFLVWREGRYIHKVSRSGLVYKLEVLSPAEASAPADDVDNGLQLSMMMWAGFRIGMDNNRARPKLLCADAGVGNSLSTSHTRSLRSIAVEFAAADNAQPQVRCSGF